jgi:hypothetical protein
LGLTAPPGREDLVWKSSIPGEGSIATARLLSPPDQALIIALRGSPVQKALLFRLLDIDWRELQERAAALGIDQHTIRFGGEKDPDERSGPGTLLVRHRRRYRSCPDHCKPSSFTRYLRQYYSWSWQSEGILSGFKSAVGRRLSG